MEKQIEALDRIGTAIFACFFAGMLWMFLNIVGGNDAHATVKKEFMRSCKELKSAEECDYEYWKSQL